MGNRSCTCWSNLGRFSFVVRGGTFSTRECPCSLCFCSPVWPVWLPTPTLSRGFIVNTHGPDRMQLLKSFMLLIKLSCPSFSAFWMSICLGFSPLSVWGSVDGSTSPIISKNLTTTTSFKSFFWSSVGITFIATSAYWWAWFLKHLISTEGWSFGCWARPSIFWCSPFLLKLISTPSLRDN